eukprot:9391515-Pyramimonas_sp.AAC.1
MPVTSLSTHPPATNARGRFFSCPREARSSNCANIIAIIFASTFGSSRSQTKPKASAPAQLGNASRANSARWLGTSAPPVASSPGASTDAGARTGA